jgi:hypothetical protein
VLMLQIELATNYKMKHFLGSGQLNATYSLGIPANSNCKLMPNWVTLAITLDRTYGSVVSELGFFEPCLVAWSYFKIQLE